MNLKDYNPLDRGLTVAIVSPPGWGKSTFAAGAVKSLLEKGKKSFILLAPGREATQYSGLDAEAEIIEEDGWEPASNHYEAKAMNMALQGLARQKKTDVGLVVGDTASTILSYSVNLALSGYKTDDWSKLEKAKFNVWASVRAKGLEFCLTMDSVRSTGKHVIMLFHQDIKESEGFGTPTTKLVEGKKTLAWDSAKVPAVSGSLRDEIAGKFDIFGFIEKKDGQHFLRLRAGQFDGAKNAIPGLTQELIPLSWDSLFEAVQEALGRKKA